MITFEFSIAYIVNQIFYKKTPISSKGETHVVHNNRRWANIATQYWQSYSIKPSQATAMTYAMSIDLTIATGVIYIFTWTIMYCISEK